MSSSRPQKKQAQNDVLLYEATLVEIAEELARRGTRFAFAIVSPGITPINQIGYSYATDVPGLLNCIEQYAVEQQTIMGPVPPGIVFVDAQGDVWIQNQTDEEKEDGDDEIGEGI